MVGEERKKGQRELLKKPATGVLRPAYSGTGKKIVREGPYWEDEVRHS